MKMLLGVVRVDPKKLSKHALDKGTEWQLGVPTGMFPSGVPNSNLSLGNSLAQFIYKFPAP